MHNFTRYCLPITNTKPKLEKLDKNFKSESFCEKITQVLYYYLIDR